MPEPAAVLLDDFNRADTGPPPSSQWTNGVFTFVGGEGLLVVSNRCSRPAGGSFRQGSYWNASLYGPDCCVIVDLGAWTNTFNNGISIYLRLVQIGSGTTDGYAVHINRDVSSTVWGIQRMTNGAGTDIAPGVAQAIAAGDKLALQTIGPVIEAWIKPSGGNWTLVTRAIDTTYAGAGSVGIEITGTNQETGLDNFSVGQLWRGAFQ
jgi:hypothetical protein